MESKSPPRGEEKSPFVPIPQALIPVSVSQYPSFSTTDPAQFDIDITSFMANWSSFIPQALDDSEIFSEIRLKSFLLISGYVRRSQSSLGHAFPMELVEIVARYSYDEAVQPSALFAAIEFGYMNLLIPVLFKYLDRQSWACHIISKEGWTSRILAMKKGHYFTLYLMQKMEFSKSSLNFSTEDTDLLSCENYDVVCAYLAGSSPSLLEWALDWACAYKNFEWIRRFLISTESDCELPWKIKWDHVLKDTGSTPLFAAVENNVIDVLQFLFKKNVDISATISNERNIFYVAAEKKHLDAIKVIYEHITTIWKGEEEKISDFVNREDTEKGDTPLSLVCSEKKLEIFKYIANAIEAQFPKRFDNHSWIELYEHGDFRSISVFLSNCNDWIVSDFMKWACSQNKMDLVQRLMNDQIINVHKNYNPFSLWTAFTEKHYAMMEMLITEGSVDVNVQRTPDKYTMFNVAVKENDMEMIQFLLKHNVNANERDGKGRTPLFIAAQNNRVNIIRFLLENNVDLCTVTKGGRNVFHAAASKGHTDVLKVIYEHIQAVWKGEDQKITDFVNANDLLDGDTPLLLACLGGYVEAVNYLVTTVKVDVQRTDSDGETPLMVAKTVGKNQGELVRILSQHQVNSISVDQANLSEVRDDVKEDEDDENENDTMLYPVYKRPKDDPSIPSHHVEVTDQ